MVFSAILFDMDGVLIDTKQSVTDFWVDLAQKYDVELTESIFAHHIYGTPAVHTLATCFPMLSRVECDAVLSALTVYEKGLTYRAVKGVIPFIDALRQADIARALVTSAEPRKVENVMAQLGIEGWFSAVVTSNDVKKGKPDPQCYLLGAERVGQAPERCIVFEDAISGVKAGVAAGMTCVGIQQGAGKQALLGVGAQYVVPDFQAVRLDGMRLVIGAAHSLVLETSGL